MCIFVMRCNYVCVLSSVVCLWPGMIVLLLDELLARKGYGLGSGTLLCPSPPHLVRQSYGRLFSPNHSQHRHRFVFRTRISV